MEIKEEDKNIDRLTKIAEAAAGWWCAKLLNPSFKNGDQWQGLFMKYNSFNSDLEGLEEFQKELTTYVFNMLNEGIDHIILSSDYGPDGNLAEIAEKVCLKANFPWKTRMFINKQYIEVVEGYRADYKLVFAYDQKEYENIIAERESKRIIQKEKESDAKIKLDKFIDQIGRKDVIEYLITLEKEDYLKSQLREIENELINKVNSSFGNCYEDYKQDFIEIEIKEFYKKANKEKKKLEKERSKSVINKEVIKKVLEIGNDSYIYNTYGLRKYLGTKNMIKNYKPYENTNVNYCIEL